MTITSRRINPAEASGVAAEARRVLKGNRQSGTSDWDGMQYDFVCPSPTHYPFQWFWDSAFHAIALLHVDPELAKQELRCLMQGAQPDGFIAHMLLWEREAHAHWLKEEYSIRLAHPYFTATIQPPVVVRAVERIFEATGDAAFVREMLPPMARFFDWLAHVRDPDHDGLIAVLQADETGLDESPKFDEYLGVSGDDRPDYDAAWHRVADPYAEVGRDPARMLALDRFIDEDVMVNTIYAENQRVLGDLLEQVGDIAAAADFRARASRTRDALVEKCWDPEAGLFWDLAGLAERPLRTSTFTSLLPLLLPDLPAPIATRLIAQLEDPGAYATLWPIPSCSRSEPAFRPGAIGEHLLWRGATWINVNWFLCRGLRRHGRPDLARRIEDSTATMIEREGFREYYDTLTGEGRGAPAFGWSALILDLLEARALEA